MKVSTARSTILAALLLLTLGNFAQGAEREWQFRVLLDGKPIGTHNFHVKVDGDQRRLRSEADFKVKFLFVTAYRYQHENVERWSGDCLRDIDARTITNGKEQEVVGEQEGQRFVIQKPQDRPALPSCVMTFAYWNPDFLRQPRLLNPQTGEYLDVSIESLGDDEIQVRGEERKAQRYRVKAKDTDLQLWYSQDNEWLALESEAKGGRKLRYELI